MTPLTPDSTPEEVREVWTAALESGDYEQTRAGHLGYPHTRYSDEPTAFCCLGVLCDLAIKAGLRDESIAGGRFNWGASYPVRHVADWAGLVDTSGAYADGNASLATLNDGGYGFAEIVTIIRAEPEGLFK